VLIFYVVKRFAVLTGSVEEEDEEKLAAELKGNTLRVYWYVLKSGGSSVGVRETQRALSFSSPQLAAYHLEKLEELGLVERKRGEYFLAKTVKVGVLKQFMKFGGFLIPRYVFYAATFTTLLILYLSKFEQVNFYSVFALMALVLGAVIFWCETVTAWRQKP
jgi:hypothetical protein